jgi:hypothetical protein
MLNQLKAMLGKVPFRFGGIDERAFTAGFPHVADELLDLRFAQESFRRSLVASECT